MPVMLGVLGGLFLWIANSCQDSSSDTQAYLWLRDHCLGRRDDLQRIERENLDETTDR
jgi:hypothetical protein